MNSFLQPSLWSSKSAAAATGGICLVDWRADGVTINSRDVNPGDLFVAIKGPRFDGHDFVKDALAAGASAAVVDHRPDLLGIDAPILEVADTKLALEELAIASRQRSKAKIIAVTGSVGKTSLKEALSVVLNEQAACTVSWGNLNNHLGVPLSLSRMSANTDFGVFEIGMNHPGEIVPLTKMLKQKFLLALKMAEFAYLIAIMISSTVFIVQLSRLE
jgi:UDP-N-acetylmuramyl pentapeptide synthase